MHWKVRMGLALAAGGVAPWAICGTLAFAGPPEAEACAARLAPQGQVMFRAVAEHVKPDSDIPALMRDHVRPLVMSGRLSRQDAQKAAPSVGRCLMLLKP